jgi:hypothetical protein
LALSASTAYFRLSSPVCVESNWARRAWERLGAVHFCGSR